MTLAQSLSESLNVGFRGTRLDIELPELPRECEHRIHVPVASRHECVLIVAIPISLMRPGHEPSKTGTVHFKATGETAGPRTTTRDGAGDRRTWGVATSEYAGRGPGPDMSRVKSYEKGRGVTPRGVASNSHAMEPRA